MSIVNIATGSLKDHLGQVKKDNDKINAVKQDLNRHVVDLNEIKMKFGEIARIQEENKRENSRLAQELADFKNDILDQLNDHHEFITKEVFQKNLAEITDCIESFIVNSTPRQFENKIPDLEDKIEQLEKKINEMEMKKVEIPTIEIHKSRVALDTEPEVLFFKKPQKKKNDV